MTMRKRYVIRALAAAHARPATFVVYDRLYDAALRDTESLNEAEVAAWADLYNRRNVQLPAGRLAAD
jgi:hypothetical protein